MFRASLYLVPIFEILQNKGLTDIHILDIYRQWDFFNPLREQFLSKGFQRLFEGDYISAMHILVPQFEACLREMFFGIEVSTTVVRPKMTQHEQVMSEFLLRDEVREVLSENFVTYIEIVMVSQNGLNIRNNIAHGLAVPGIFVKESAVIILHLFLLLFGYKIVSDDESSKLNDKGK